MPKYIVTHAFVSTLIGPHADGEVLELTAAEAQGVAPFIKPFEEQAIETADLKPELETADIKAPKRKK
jgi:hypothetical protein